VPDKEFYSFDEALDELRLKEEELKRLVSEGEIRAFRKGDTMKLKKADVENLRLELSGGDVVDLGDATEELVFEDDSDLEEEAGMATQEIEDVETIVDDDIEDVGELDLDDDDDIAVARPVRRAAAVAEEEETEGTGMLVAMIASVLLMIVSIPIILGVSSGDASDLAKSLAGIVAEFPE
jgi:excisionase family DNA binding protein